MSEELNVGIVQRNGPNMITGDLAILTPARVLTMKTVMLCRCGQSSDQPFCDGTHVKTGFADPGQLPANGPAGELGAGRLTITPLPNGPNRCEGPLLVRGVDGRTCAANLTFLCRCGASSNKPYCDGTHKRIGLRT
jgi:CDGSH-type Zn-finger protein